MTEEPKKAAPDEATAGDGEAEAKKRGCLTRLCIWSALILIVCGGLAYGIYRIQLARFESQLAYERDRIRKAGYPATMEELNAWYESPPEGVVNGAEAYERAFAKLDNSDHDYDDKLPFRSDVDLPANTVPMQTWMRDAVAAALKDNAEALALLHEAAKHSQCRYGVSFAGAAKNASDGPSDFFSRLDHLHKARPAARLLAIEAVLKADGGDGDGAVRSIEASLALAASLEDEPWLLSQLVRIACSRMSIQSLERVVNRTKPSDARLRAIAAAMKRAESTEPFARALAGDRCFGLLIFQEHMKVPLGERLSIWSFSGPPSFLSRGRMRYYVSRGWLADDLDEYLKSMKLLLREQTALQPNSINAIKQEASRQERRHSDLKAARGYTFADGGVSAPASYHHAFEHVARLRVARLAIALERYRRATALLPYKLSALVPEAIEAVPTDPFSGKPLRYARLERGFRAWSVGPDGDDDGGKRGKPDEAGTDIVFEVVN